MNPSVYPERHMNKTSENRSEYERRPVNRWSGRHGDTAELVDLGVASPRAGITQRVQRMADIFICTLALLLLFPIFLLIAVAIKLDSPGAVLFTQQRVGIKGSVFKMYKFRSMRRDAEQVRESFHEDNERDGPVFKIKKDPRITRVGFFLRRWSLDELPQLLNVIKGEMSLVGPRPALPSEVATYTPRQLMRLAVVPGLTGLWQISGRANVPFAQSIELDLHYIQNQSVWLNLWIILRTLPKVISGEGAY
jgi:lipopolysaccharide/colanic/teichoic acid biosynthesis glycosyltransferase